MLLAGGFLHGSSSVFKKGGAVFDEAHCWTKQSLNLVIVWVTPSRHDQRLNDFYDLTTFISYRCCVLGLWFKYDDRTIYPLLLPGRSIL